MPVHWHKKQLPHDCLKKRGKENEQQWEKEPAAFFRDRRRMNLFQSRFIFIGIKGNAIRK